MRFAVLRAGRFALAVLLSCAACLAPSAQQVLVAPEIPDRFKLDLETAARLRPQLLAQSVPAVGKYETGRIVFETLIRSAALPKGRKVSWELRIAIHDALNAYSSPDGTIYVDRNLAQLAGPSAGLWAAILSHEIAHVIRRDWARRYLYEKLLRGAEVTLGLGDPGRPSASWIDSRQAAADLARFCRQLELDADLDSLTLMAHAGYHPDFAPALHHLLHAFGGGGHESSINAMHPCWETRDRDLSRAYTAARLEFGHLWPAWYASPGGNPPIVVFADEPTVRKAASRQWEIQVPMRCQNLAGAVEVVLLARPARERVIANATELPASTESGSSPYRQLTGCTSPKTTITFNFFNQSDQKSGALPTDVFILDAEGSVLSRAEIPELQR